jgi:hypothetical protein
VAYSNGRINTSTLTPVPSQPHLRLRSGVATAWAALCALVLVTYGWVVTLTDAYRDYPAQERIFRQRYTTTYLPGRPSKVWLGKRWYLKAGYAAAATPGTSNHGYGITVDVANLGGFTSARYRQFATLAVASGWSNAEGKSINEPWHWNYTGPADTTSKPGGGTGTVPAAPELPTVDPIARLLEEPMPVRVRQTNGAVYYVDLTKGSFRALDPTANSIVDKLDVPITWDGLDSTDRNKVRQLVIDLSTPKIDA